MAVIKDVAKKAGLSVSAVSKYLNSPDTVREDTKVRIEAAIKELNYVPSIAARSMRTKRSKMVAVLVPDIQDEFYAKIFSYMNKYVLAKGYTPILYTTEHDDVLLPSYLRKMSIASFEGIIPCFIDEDKFLNECIQINQDVPVVMLSGIKEDVHACAVTDLHLGSYIATKHLIDQGYQKIAFVGSLKSSKSNIAKFDGYVKALKEAKMTVHEDFQIYGKSRYKEGYLAAKQLLHLEVSPDAVVTANDAVAAGFIKYAVSHGFRVPEDVGVMGFDNVPIAAIYEPGISTIELSLQEMCCAAVDLLIEIIKGNTGVPMSVNFVPKLIARKTTDRRHILSNSGQDLFTE